MFSSLSAALSIGFRNINGTQFQPLRAVPGDSLFDPGMMPDDGDDALTTIPATLGPVQRKLLVFHPTR